MPATEPPMPTERDPADVSFSVDYRPVDHAGSRFFVPAYAVHRPASRQLLRGTFYEPATHRLMQRLLPERGGDLVHAGTFFGDMLPTFAAACAGRVYAFEPVLESYILAKLCLIHNEINNVALFNAGLGDALGIVHMSTEGGGGRHRGGSSRIAETGQVTTLFAIDLLPIERLAVIQLDVEGHELPALQGADQTIARHRPVIMVEDNKRTCAPFLTERGYERAGRIPGLKIWCDPKDRAQVDAAVAAAKT